MRNVIKCMVLVMILSTISGCGIQSDSQNTQNQASPIPSMKTFNTPGQNANSDNSKPTVQANTESNQNKVNTTNPEMINNPFFFKNNISVVNYKGVFLFDEEEGMKKDIKLHINEVASSNSGKLYELKLDPIKDIPSERLNLGYFYVQKDKIYWLEPTDNNLNKIKTTGKVPDNSMVVCQNEEQKDSLSKDEHGLHHYIEVDGESRIFHLFNNETETGYYETLTWEKNKGIVNYRSGYGAEKDSIDLQLSDN